MAGADYERAAELTGRSDTCVHSITAKQHIALNPKFISHMAKGIREELNGQLNLYSDRLEGVPIAFGNVTCSKSYADILDEQPFLHLDCQAEAVVFKPMIGSRLLGLVNKLGHDHVGCLVHNVFNAAIHRPRAAKDTWVGADVCVGQEVVIEVTKLQIFNGVVSIRGNIIETRAVSDDINVAIETPKSAKKKQKKKKNESVSGQAADNLNASAVAETCNLSLMSTKDNENESVGSFDSGLGALTPPPERSLSTERAIQIEALATPDINQMRLNQSLNETSVLDESALQGDVSKSKKKKKKKRKESLEQEVIGDQMESVNITAATETDSLSSAIKTEFPVSDTISSSSKKKKRKKSHEPRLENVEQSISSISGADFQNPLSLVTRLVKSEMSTTDSAQSSTKKKKRKKSLDPTEILGQTVGSSASLNSLNESFLNVNDIKSETITVDTPSAKKKTKKHKKSLDPTELQLSADFVENKVDQSFASTFESQTDFELSLSSTKKKKKAKRKDFIDDVPIQQFSIKTEANSDDNIASLPVSSFQLETVPAAPIKVESQDTSGETSKKKRKRKHSESFPLDLDVKNEVSHLSPPAKKKKKKKHSLP